MKIKISKNEIFYTKKSIYKYNLYETLINNIINEKLSKLDNINNNQIELYKNQIFFYLGPLYNVLKNNDPNRKTIHSKYLFIMNIILKNTPLAKYIYEKENVLYQLLMDIINSYQKIRFKLLYVRYFLHIKYKKYKVYDCDFDIKMNEFSEIDNKFKFKIIEDNTIYTFNIQNLRFIMKNTLYSNEYMCIKPSHPKNPYTNKIFTLGNMYKIYIKMRETNIPIPYYIDLYYKTNLNIFFYTQMNRTDLEKNAVHNFIYYTCEKDLLDYVLDMFYFSRQQKITSIFIVEPTNEYLDQLNKNKVKIFVNESKKILFLYLLMLKISDKNVKNLYLQKFNLEFNIYLNKIMNKLIELFEIQIEDTINTNRDMENIQNIISNFFTIGINRQRQNRNRRR